MQERIETIYELCSENISALLAVSAIVILLLCGGTKYLNIFGIIKCYTKEFINKNLFFGLALCISPVLLSLSICLSRSITNQDIEIITVAISILMALFFSFLTSFSERKKYIEENINDYSEYTQKIEVIDENITIVSYEILLSIIILICCFIFNFIHGFFFNIIIYSLYIHLLLNLLLLLKRFNKNNKT